MSICSKLYLTSVKVGLYWKRAVVWGARPYNYRHCRLQRCGHRRRRHHLPWRGHSKTRDISTRLHGVTCSL